MEKRGSAAVQCHDSGSEGKRDCTEKGERGRPERDHRYGEREREREREREGWRKNRRERKGERGLLREGEVEDYRWLPMMHTPGPHSGDTWPLHA
ncbi:hypothetical protein RHMOL_Rhmol09G0007900 [Rhododendron molle]|uniref:Uncharacterized protein n=1 Tax=Rhododendron molle TaxID=49168 RepID=A0ACC0MA79_RHOML|nr:hypothetical protein RHMOL_Rhmol09G0007900 [Rhododendron molle]